MPDYETIKLRHWALLALGSAILFGLLAGWPSHQSGMNPDEWRFSVGLERNFADVHGRWALHWAHEYLVGADGPELIQLAITFLALFLTSSLIAMRAVAPCRAFMRMGFVTLTFFVGFSHVYMTEIMDYSSQVAWFATGLLCSTVALALVEPVRNQTAARLIVRMIASAELLALSIGFYQSYALVGFLLPAIAMIRVDRYDLRQVATYLLRTVLISVGALLLYRAELWTTIDLLGLTPHFRFAFGMSGPAVAEKLWALPGMELSIHSGRLLGMPYGIRLVLLLGLGVAAGMLLLAAWLALSPKRPKGSPNPIDALRIVIGGFGALFILPALTWFLYPEKFLLGRSIAFVGLVWAGVLGAAARQVAADTRNGALVAAAPMVAGVTMLLFGVAGSIGSAGMWEAIRSVADRDVALARSIESEASKLPGFDVVSTPIRQVGGVSYRDLAYGGFVPWGSFDREIDMNSAFQGLFGAAAPSGAAPFPPRPCPAYPAVGSVFMADGTAYVCFEEAVPLHLQNCEAVELPAGLGAVCSGDGVLVLASRDCSVIDPGIFKTVITFEGTAGGLGPRAVFNSKTRATMINGICYRFIYSPEVEFTSFVAQGQDAGGNPWTAEGDTKRVGPLDQLLVSVTQ